MPWSHDAFQQMTVLELLTDYWEDYYKKRPIEAKRTEKGDVVYANTGDDLIDKWEQEISRGLAPDLYEGLPSERRVKLQQKGKAKVQLEQTLKARDEAAEGFSDDYSIQQHR